MLLTLPLLEFGERLWLAKWGEAANGLGKSTRYYLNGYIIICAFSLSLLQENITDGDRVVQLQLLSS